MNRDHGRSHQTAHVERDRHRLAARFYVAERRLLVVSKLDSSES
jgi:hypothetical protein